MKEQIIKNTPEPIAFVASDMSIHEIQERIEQLGWTDFTMSIDRYINGDGVLIVSRR